MLLKIKVKQKVINIKDVVKFKVSIIKSVHSRYN